MTVLAPTSFQRCTLSCRLEVLPGDRVIDRLHAATRLGFDAVALPGRVLPSYVDDLRACRGDRPIALSSISLGFRGSLVSPRPELRQECRESLVRLFDLCAELGIPCVNMPPVLVQDNPVRMTDHAGHASLEAAQDALLLDQLPTLVERAARVGVALSLEPVNRYESEYLTSVAHAGRLCAALQLSHLGCTVDFFHMQFEELDVAAAIESALPWIRLVHVAENTRVEPGPGSLVFEPGFRVLKRGGYIGPIEVECRALSGPAEIVLQRCADYLRGCWERA